MCPAAPPGEPPAASDDTQVAAEPEVNIEADATAGADPLAAFAVDAARRQAVERGEEAEEVDEAFITRALAESRRMRQATAKDEQKRATNMATFAARHGEQGLSTVQQAMQEHAAEVLAPAQIRATGLDGETGTEALPAADSALAAADATGTSSTDIS